MISDIRYQTSDISICWPFRERTARAPTDDPEDGFRQKDGGQAPKGASRRPVLRCGQLFLSSEFHAAAERLFVEREQVMVAFRQHFPEGCHDRPDVHHAGAREERAKHDHVRRCWTC